MAYEQGDIYPIWGTCLGFEQMVVSIAQECILKPCQAKDKMSTLIPNWYWPHSDYISGKGKKFYDISVCWEILVRQTQPTGSAYTRPFESITQNFVERSNSYELDI